MMKHLKNQEGYALLVVLLMVVLFLSISATFMAGSLNNAKQEQTIDASNQSVASAEMGVRFYSADFQREVSIIKTDILKMTQDKIKGLVDCFDSGDTSCDEEDELTVMEEKIDKEMKIEYINRIEDKAAALETLKDKQETPFPGEDAQYAIAGTAITKLNGAGKDITEPATTDKTIKSLKVQIDMSGQSKGKIKYLKGIFTIEVPDTFLSSDKSLTVETTTKEKKDLEYKNIFFETWPKYTCTSMVSDITANKIPTVKECLMESEDTIKSFIEFLEDNNLDPKDFKVYTKDFKKNICNNGNSCNNTDLSEITVVASPGDDGLFGNGNNKNFNGLTSANLIIDGLLEAHNMNNPGDADSVQTIILRELTISQNMNGQGLVNTNLLILGKESEVPKPDGAMDFQGHVVIGDKGTLCFDFDRIKEADRNKLKEKVTFKHDNTTGQIIYYTKDLDANKFELPEKGDLSSEEMTKRYVVGYDNYTNFLSSCGVTVSETIEELTGVPLPYMYDPEFELDVEY